MDPIRKTDLIVQLFSNLSPIKRANPKFNMLLTWHFLSNISWYLFHHFMNSISTVSNLPLNLGPYGHRRRLTGRRSRITAVSEVVFVPGDPEITWQIVVGTLAGVTPFVVAGIEFSKRIVAQKKCTECGGSGLVLIEKEYIRCPNCGGFLPWQSWQRFFSG